MKNSLEQAKECIDKTKEMVEIKIKEAEEDSNEMVIWLNYKIELADIQYRLKDMLSYLPKVKK